MKKLFGILVFATSLAAFGLPQAGLTDLATGKPADVKHGKDKELVVFWATWCPDCRKKLDGELPKLNKRKDVAVITVNTDRSAKRAQSYVDRNDVKLPVLLDPSKKLRKSLKVFSVPHWAVYHKGTLVDAGSGYNEAKVNKALGIN